MKINHRLKGRSSHIGGPASTLNLKPHEITEEMVKERRAAREDLEDQDLFRDY